MPISPRTSSTSRRLFKRVSLSSPKTGRDELAVAAISNPVPVSPAISPVADHIFHSLSTTFFSYNEATKALRIFREAVESRLFGGSPAPMAAVDQVYRDWVGSLEMASVTRENYQALYKSLYSSVQSTAKLAVYLPFVPSRAEIKSVYSLALAHLKSPFLLDIRFDKDLIGGCAFVWQGKYIDVSLKSRLQVNKDAVQGILARYNVT